MDQTDTLSKILRNHYGYSQCMKKFEENPSVISSDLSCRDKIAGHWLRVRQYCSENNCFYRDSWKKDHQKFVKVMGHLQGQKPFHNSLFDEKNIF
ncbi:hypothetical protein [Brazilian marseillevirus]|uniref:hypothetical protein n=1 Tax=Brazilian marseillevirus TaxID=1813599 RepID=UPI000784B131|nr:hypothetical protein A3303_gp290 [Brazilian marseillevirus]AMQ10798.1 hypothetical protein [Brazilian marseillevirus]